MNEMYYLMRNFRNEELGIRNEELRCQLSLTYFKPLSQLKLTTPFKSRALYGIIEKPLLKGEGDRRQAVEGF